MKRRKIKLFASVASFALVAAVMSFGVFAALNHTVSVTSNVTFSAQGVKGTIAGAVYNTTKPAGEETWTADKNWTVTEGEEQTTVISFDSTMEESLGTWAVGAISFTDYQAPITYVFTIGNTGTVDIVAAFTGITTDDATLAAANIDVTVTGGTIEAGESGEITVVLTVIDAATKIDAQAVNFGITLDAAPAEG